MKKILIFLMAASLIVSPNFAFAEYLVTGKNYYTDDSIKKWFLDEEISENTVLKANFDSLKKSSEKNFIIWKDGMTFNEFYLANNISPEDNFYAWLNPWFPLIYLDDARTIKLNSNYTPKAPFVTYVWPTNNDGWPYWTRNPAAITKPSFFSRLTVGDLEKWTFSTDNNNVQTPNENKKLLKFDRDWYVFPNMIWYGENNTVNDYMLTAENNFLIPARYNTVRNDVHLTLRSQGFWWFDNNDARGFLEVKEGNENIVSKKENPKKYINTKTNIFITPIGFAQLGDDRWGWWIPGWKTIVKEWRYKEVSKNMENISAENFVKNINNVLKEITQYSGTNSIASWNGWQIQMEWFYRDGADTDFLIDQTNRESDAQKILDVKFFMYYNTPDSVNIRGTKLNVTTPKASNGKNLYSPNESVFKIEITRPYFSNFWNLNDEIIFDEKNFDEKLWEKSFEILDAGLEKDWNKIWVDKSRIKLRLSEDGVNFSDKIFTFDELKQEFQKDENVWKTFKIAYTYAAKDANDENIWKLPTEITDNTGAFAIPFVRTVKISEQFTVTLKFVDDKGTEIAPPEIYKKKKDENFNSSYIQNRKNIAGYEFQKVTGNESGAITQNTEIVYVYKKLPQTSKIMLLYLDENNNEIQKEEKTGNIGDDYNFPEKIISWYEFVKMKDGDSKTGKFEQNNKSISFVYRKKSGYTSGQVINIGAGWYVAAAPQKLLPNTENTNTIPLVTTDNNPIFKTQKIGGQCVSAVTNLDDTKLIEYYQNTLNISSHRQVNTAISRAEFMKILFLASGINLDNIPTFEIADLPKADINAKYIFAGIHYGLIHGQTDGVKTYLRPNDTISRGEAAKIFIRAAQLKTIWFSGIFSDVKEKLTLSEYIESAYDNCFLHGRNTRNGEPIAGKKRVFEPFSPITIAESSKVLYNMTH